MAGLRHDRRLARSAGNALVAALACAVVAVAALEYALLTHDFSLVQVVDHTSRGLPLVYTITSLWASQPGSLLLWLTVLTACGALVTYQNRNRNRELMPWVTAVIGGVMVFFASMTAFVSSPFEKVSGATPTAGLGPRSVAAEPLHGDPPADALSRLRVVCDAVCLRDGGAGHRAVPMLAGCCPCAVGR